VEYRYFLNSSDDRIIGTPQDVRAYAREVRHGQIAKLRSDDPRISAFNDQHFIEMEMVNGELQAKAIPEPVVPEVEEVVEPEMPPMEPIVVFDYPVTVTAEDEAKEVGDSEDGSEDAGSGTPPHTGDDDPSSDSLAAPKRTRAPKN
jgi:hypothetical protein